MLTAKQREQFNRDGYIIIEDALAEIGLDRVRAAYERIQAETEPAWRASVVNGTYKGGYGNGPDAHTMGNVYQYDDIFLDLADNPQVTPIIEEIVGENYQVMEMVCHCHHTGTGAHTGWHRDWPPYLHPQYSLKAKVFYFLDDQTADMGCFSLVPGSHKWPENPPKDIYIESTLEDMPDMKKMTGPAGSAVIWDVVCWHTGLANTSPKDRRLAIYGYMPFWVKKWGSQRPPQNIIAWANTPRRRQMMGIHAVQGRASWDRQDVPYLPEHEELVKAKKF